MTLAAPLTLTVAVRYATGAHHARILDQGIRASSTNSSAVAVQTAVAKLIARDHLIGVTSARQAVRSMGGDATWIVVLYPTELFATTGGTGDHQGQT